MRHTSCLPACLHHEVPFVERILRGYSASRRNSELATQAVHVRRSNFCDPDGSLCSL